MKTALLTLASLLWWGVSAVAQDPNFHVYLCFGQSNMEGFPGIEEEDKAGVNERFQVLAAVDFPSQGRVRGQWYPAVPPLCRPRTGLGPADYFGRRLVAGFPESVRVGVVNVSVAGCKIELFDPANYQAYVAKAPGWMTNILETYGGNPYALLVEMGRRAQKDGVIKGVLLHQGESNSGDREWPTKVKAIYDHLLTDLHLDARQVPLLVGELVHADQQGACAGMNAVIDDLPRTIPTAHVVSSAGCASRPDHLHFSPAGYRELGRRYAERMLALLNPGSAAARPTPVPSPEVHPDRTVTFRFRAPDAGKVELAGQFLERARLMDRDAAGVWTLTVGPIDPDLYPYNFVADGIAVADPGNPDLFPNERFKASLVDIPSEPPGLHALRDVPHGELVYGYYPSRTLGRTRPLVVYTPPGYRTGNERYPVLYLVSGTTDTEETWFRAGRANFILDNLIALKRAVPMIVVMPYGNMMMGTPAPNSLQAADMYKVFDDELTGNIIPYVEAQYRTLPEREKRAIAGFSRGGGQSLFAGFNHPETFAWIGSYSAYLTPEVCTRFFPTLVAQPEAANGRLKLLWLGVGKQDFLYRDTVAFIDFLRDRRIAHRTLITEGGHTWMNARHYLAETLQLYFQ